MVSTWSDRRNPDDTLSRYLREAGETGEVTHDDPLPSAFNRAVLLPRAQGPAHRVEGRTGKPAHRKGAGLVLPRCTPEGMTLPLNEIAQAVIPSALTPVLRAVSAP